MTLVYVYHCVVARVKCEGEWNSIVLSATFVALSINLLGTIMARLNSRSRIATFVEEIANFL